MKKEIATFALGCFWQPDYIFSKVKGVLKTRVGYTGCNASCKNPSYEEVCDEKTGCAEAIEITFNPEEITYDQLLDLFWQSHDPTQEDGQGPDIGSQYRSAIFFHNAEQEKAIAASHKKWSSRLKDKTKHIVTQIVQASPFYEAESYHQKYLEKTGRSCHISRSPFK